MGKEYPCVSALLIFCLVAETQNINSEMRYKIEFYFSSRLAKTVPKYSCTNGIFTGEFTYCVMCDAALMGSGRVRFKHLAGGSAGGSDNLRFRILCYDVPPTSLLLRKKQDINQQSE